ncbi:MAG TPA: bifunctional diguanylate cyclase/phosphodiesterase [Mycobacteriales bacterium]|jgi:diguanylate cyclase (GGDEF)-like protein|nr:bifunctional diguanylate cyclase/phosphodiesterase [Mycobacteriales bacterium]
MASAPSRGYRPFVAGVYVLGLVAGAVALWSPVQPTAVGWGAYTFLALGVIIGELRPIMVPRGDTTDAITVSTTLALVLALLGPLWLAVAAQAVGVALDDLRVRKSPVKVAFNIAQYTVTLVATRVVFCALSGVPLLGTAAVQLPEQLPAALLAGVTYVLVNNGLAGTVEALVLRRPVLTSLLEDVRFQLGTAGVLLAFAPVVLAALQASAWLLPLAVLPLQAIYANAHLAATREREAMHDGLTGLGNRTLLRLRVRAAQEQADVGYALLLVDLDHFREINDTLGHPVGDELLREVAGRLRAGLRAEDTVCRLGGDEFAVFVPRHGAPDGLDIAARLLAGLEESFVVDGARLDVDASVGVALYPEHGRDLDLLLQRADVALYRAKAERGTACLYDASSDLHTRKRLALATELRDALTAGNLFCVYQPKVDTVTGLTVGVEALVRWQHSPDVVLMPDTFLAVAENTGLVRPLTLAVLEMALSDQAAWRGQGYDLELAVNLSVRHLTDLELPGQVERLLRRHRARPESLVLEVTETAIMSDPVRALAVLDDLRELGVGLAIDDFGTGYSSLSYLDRMAVDELKIDKSFVTGLSSGLGNASIVRSTIELGHSLGLRLVAEGVEDEPCLDLVRAWGCDQVQGYLLSRPMPADALPGWLDARAPAATG